MRQRMTAALAFWLTATVPARAGQSAQEDFIARLAGARMVVEFDRRTGSLYSLRETGGKFGTNYLGNPANHPGSAYDDPAWTGNVVATVWELDLPEKPVVLIPSFSFRPSGRWRRESTGNSGDIRSVTFDGERFVVRYSGPSKNDGGIRSFDLSLTYRLVADHSLNLEIEVANTTGRLLAEKNVYFPDAKEIATLEAYVEDCLRKHIQNQETFALRASLYWKERLPSSPWGHWTEQRSKETYRTYNYPHAANVYHALYRIGKIYGLTKRQAPQEYLRLAWNTAMKWFQTGPWRHVGLMGGSNVIRILADLEAEGWEAEHRALLEEVRACNRVFVETPYPYSSELFVDQTAHEQVYFFTRHFGDAAKAALTLQVIRALRGGAQPVWFRYGNDNRGDMAGWYTTSLNSRPLLAGFEETGDSELLIQGYAGLMAVTANLLPDGMGFGHYISTPGVQDFEPPRTLDNGIGMYGFFKAAKSYVFRDESFGMIGAGCDVEVAGDRIAAKPRDGLRKRLRFVESRIDIEAERGEIVTATIDSAGGSLVIEAADSTGLVTAGRIVVRGLAPGRYSVAYGKRREAHAVSGALTLQWPLAEAGKISIVLFR